MPVRTLRVNSVLELIDILDIHLTNRRRLFGARPHDGRVLRFSQLSRREARQRQLTNSGQVAMATPGWTGRLSAERLGLLGHHPRHRHRRARKKRNRAHAHGCSNDGAAEVLRRVTGKMSCRRSDRQIALVCWI